MRLLRHFPLAAALGLGTSLTLSFTMGAAPAKAQFTVFDPTNYTQNLLTAARTLEQINNQIHSLQNEATMLLNQAKNLRTISFPQMEELSQRLKQINQLMEEAQGIDFRVDRLDERFRQLFPQDFERAVTADQQVREARARLETSMSGFRHAMSVQSQVVENVRSDAQALGEIVSRSQSAEGALQVGQATNQLLALTAKQQFQLQQLLTAQFRSDALEHARSLQESQEARAAAKRFLGEGRAYTPDP